MHGINQPRASIPKPRLVKWWSRSLLVPISISLSLLLLVREFLLLLVLCGTASHAGLQLCCAALPPCHGHGKEQKSSPAMGMGEAERIPVLLGFLSFHCVISCPELNAARQEVLGVLPVTCPGLQRSAKMRSERFSPSFSREP